MARALVNPPSAPTWSEMNQRVLAGALDQIKTALKRHAERADPGADTSASDKAERAVSAPPVTTESAAASGTNATIDNVTRLFHLSPFERSVLLLCAGLELDASFAGLCAEAQGDPARPYPTFSLALASLPGAHWSALSPAGPLRRRRLIEIGAGSALTLSPLRIDERILNALIGVNHLDERLVGTVDAVPPAGALVPSHAELAAKIASIWAESGLSPSLPAIQLCGGESAAKRSIAAAACVQMGMSLGCIGAETLPTGPADLETLIRLWEREAALTNSALLLESDDSLDLAASGAVGRVIDRTHGVLILSSLDRRPARQKPMITFDVGKPTLFEQRALWTTHLGDAAANLNGHLETLTAQFDSTDNVIRAASAQALGELARLDKPAGITEEDRTGTFAASLWDACRMNSRPRMDDLAQRIDARADWDDLVLPEPQRRILRDIASHVQQRATVYERWGFAAKGARGLGISALFAGTSGTGKTMAAEVLARNLRLDLYRIDLSAVVSKYIGESEKNLRRVFDSAEEGGSILLFDQADALFGKRSETKDSHDRYANIEVSYLLQRMESYRGLAILTTNLKKSLDAAFLRRLRFVVEFPFPDAEERAEIWRRSFPEQTPLEGLDYLKLSRLNVAGGNIRNAALNAAFFAADDRSPVKMVHCLRAAQAEYVKLEKTLTEAETAGWV